MEKIHVLEKETVDKIAAGEAVERPAAIVKELVENSLDAGARAVTVEIRDGGISYIRVSDDGCGIGADDIRNAFRRHATSKIRSADDLMFLNTMGFRGEALASIAAVSRVEVITKEASELSAVRYVIEGGEEKALEETGAPDGTTFFVRDVFFNTPARAKFLKSALSEGAKIGQLMEELTLSRPQVAFRFLVNGQLRLNTGGNGDLKDAILLLFGKETAKELIYVSSAAEGIRVNGYIAKPAIYRNNRGGEHYFINERYVRSTLLAKAIEDGYRGKLMQHCFPFTVLHLAIDTDTVDVNVHPTKTEVRILSETVVYEAVRSAVAEALRNAEMVVTAPIGTPGKKTPAAAERRTMRQASPEPFEKKFGGTYEKAAARLFAHDPGLIAEGAPKYSSEKKESGTQTEAAAELKTARPVQEEFLAAQTAPRLIGQAFGTYWMFEEPDSVLIMDQHAAHEKILFERIMAAYKKKEILKQQLLPPVILTPSSAEEAVLTEHGSAFALLGFEVEPFGEGQFRIDTVPYNLAHTDPGSLFKELLAALAEGEAPSDPDSYVHALATEACKAAVKGGTHVTEQQAKGLITELLKCEDPYHCPHGRPTLIRMKRAEFEKKFRRIV